MEIKLLVTKGETEGGINSETWIDIYILLYIKQIIGTYCIGNSQYFVMTWKDSFLVMERI